MKCLGRKSKAEAIDYKTEAKAPVLPGADIDPTKPSSSYMVRLLLGLPIKMAEHTQPLASTALQPRLVSLDGDIKLAIVGAKLRDDGRRPRSVVYWTSYYEKELEM